MEKLTIFTRGKYIFKKDNRWFVEYGTQTREIKNKIQIAYIHDYFTRNNSVGKLYYILELLNEFSKKHNKDVKSKNILTKEKLYNILENTKNGFYAVKKGINYATGKKYDIFYVCKPFTEKQQKQLKTAFKNIKITAGKIAIL